MPLTANNKNDRENKKECEKFKNKSIFVPGRLPRHIRLHLQGHTYITYTHTYITVG